MHMEVDIPDDQFLIQEPSTLQLAVPEDNRDMARPQQAVEQGNSSIASGNRDNVVTGTETSAVLDDSCNSRTRERLKEILHSRKAQYIVISLVILDCFIVFAELLIDLEVIKTDHHDNPAPHVLHYISIAILCIFMIEILLKVYAMGLEFFKHKLEVFDALVVIISFSLDVAFSNQSSAVDAVSMLIVLRLWRVTRIVNGIVMSVKIQAEKKITALENENKQLKEELKSLKEKFAELERQLLAEQEKSL